MPVIIFHCNFFIPTPSERKVLELYFCHPDLILSERSSNFVGQKEQNFNYSRKRKAKIGEEEKMQELADRADLHA